MYSPPKSCLIEDCKPNQKGEFRGGYCNRHRMIIKRHGDPNFPVKRQERHGMSHLSEYTNWECMIMRCSNPNTKSYEHYGGRGINICDRWRKSFKNFLKDMGNKPTPHHSVDRINTDGDYTPENCRWATPKEQANNRRNNRVLEVANV